MCICDSRSEGAEEAVQITQSAPGDLSKIGRDLGSRDQKLTHPFLVLVCYITSSVLRESLERVSGNDTGDREQQEHESKGGPQSEESGEVEHCVVVVVVAVVVAIAVVEATRRGCIVNCGVSLVVREKFER